MIERVAWAVAPPACVACGSVVDVSVKLADDMGRTIHPTSDVRVGLVFRECPSEGVHFPVAPQRSRQHADREASGEGERVHDGMAVITGASPFDDPLLSLDDGWDGDDDDESTRNGQSISHHGQHTCCLCSLPAQHRLRHTQSCMRGPLSPPSCDPSNEKCSQLANH